MLAWDAPAWSICQAVQENSSYHAIFHYCQLYHCQLYPCNSHPGCQADASHHRPSFGICTGCHQPRSRCFHHQNTHQSMPIQAVHHTPVPPRTRSHAHLQWMSAMHTHPLGRTLHLLDPTSTDHQLRGNIFGIRASTPSGGRGSLLRPSCRRASTSTQGKECRRAAK